MVANAWGGAGDADAVVLLSDVDGLFDRDPKDPAAELVREVGGIDESVRAMAGASSGSGMGSGGMVSKLQAAEIAGRAGIALAIVNGTHDRPLATAAHSAKPTARSMPTIASQAGRSLLLVLAANGLLKTSSHLASTGTPMRYASRTTGVKLATTSSGCPVELLRSQANTELSASSARTAPGTRRWS